MKDFSTSTYSEDRINTGDQEKVLKNEIFILKKMNFL